MSELKIMRSIMRIILPVSILILFFTVFNIRSDAINITMSSGNFGSNWEIKEEGGEIVLEIGEGQLDSGAINVEQDNDIKNITKIRFVGNVIANENSCGLFKSFQGLNSIENIERLDTSNVKIMQDMFRDCYELKELDVSNFNTEQVTNMSYMFRDCCELKELDVSNFNTEQVTNMSYMFCDCSNLKELDLNRFNTKQVTNMEFMFCNCSNLEKLDLSNFDTSNVDNMHSMFYNCQSLKELDISNFNTEQVTNMSEMFYYCNSLEELDLSNFNTSNVENMWYMFYNCHSLKELDLSSFNTEQVTNMDFMFSYCQSLKELDLSNFNTEQVKNMNYMFYCCYDLKELDLSNFNTSNIENEWTMYRVFYECTLERLTLGKKTLFAPKASLNQPSNDTLHTGYWVHEDDQEGVNFEPTTDLFLNYDGSIPGTYVWQGVQVGINLNLNDETENPQIKVLPARYGQTINLSKITKPQREGYTFKGWADTKPLADSKTKINVTKIDSLEVKTLYAIWTKKISSDSEDSSAKTVILATGKDYPDSLTASVLAYVKNAPILLSNFDSVDTTTLNEIKRIGATDIIIIGGNQAVSDSVVTQLQKEVNGAKISRIWGEDRYQTAIKVGEELRKLVSAKETLKSSSNLNNVILAVGTNFPDAMSVTSLAEYNNTPILLTGTDTLNSDTLNALKSWGITNVIIIGKEQAISTNVEDKIKNLSISENTESELLNGENKSVNAISVERIGGEDRYETAKLVGEKLISLLGKSNSIQQAILVDGTNFPDALTVSSLAGHYKVPVLLTQRENLNKTTENALKNWSVSKVTIAGETNAVAKEIEDELKQNVLNSMTIERLGGADRYETAVKISQKYSEVK